jgi:predicted Zn-dependent peptidase
MDAYTVGYLDNGLGFLIAPRPGAHLIHVALYLNHGVKDESADENGISHLLEHLLFNANRFPKRLAKFFEPLARSGANFEAWTGKEHTRLNLSIAPNQLNGALLFLRELLQKAPLQEKTLQHERGIVLDEIARKRASNSQLWSLFEEALFAPPYGLPVLGNPENIKQMSLRYLRRRVKDILRPGHVRLVLSGRVTAEATQCINDHFGDWSGDMQIDTTIPVEILPRAIALPSASPRVSLYLGFPAPRLTASDRSATEVLARILGSGLRSRVFRTLREEAGLAYAVGGGSVHWRQAGYLYVAVEVARERLHQSFQLLMSALDTLKSTPPDNEEIAESREGLSIQTLAEAETAGLATRLGLYWLAGETYYPRQAALAYKQVAPEAVIQAAHYLNTQRMALLGVGTTNEELVELLEVTV